MSIDALNFAEKLSEKFLPKKVKKLLKKLLSFLCKNPLSEKTILLKK
jgi:hypothetical protein